MMIPFIGGTNNHRSRDVSPQRSINLYPERVDGGHPKSEWILIGTPGTKIFSDLRESESSPCRGVYYSSTSRLFAVFGRKLYEFSNDGDFVERAQISHFSTPISFTDNGKFLLWADGYSLYHYQLETNEFLGALSLPFDNPVKITYINSRALAINQTNQFHWSELDSLVNNREGVISWPSLNFASAEGSADNITSLSKRQGELWFFGPRSYEVWRTVTDPDLPFVRVGGSFSDIGCGAIYSVADISEQVFWLGSSSAGQNQIFMSEGYNARRISTHSIEKDLDRSKDLTSDAVSFAYQQEGHIFYVLTLISADKTLVYDVSTGQWHERATREPQINVLHRWDPLYASYAFNRVLLGNSREALLLELSLDEYQEYDGRPIVRIRESPVLWQELATIFYDEFTIDINTGVGTQTGQGFDPQIMLQFSDDGGYTWSDEMWTTLGKIGTYQTRSSWTQLGSSRERVWRVVISDPVKVVMIGARAKYRIGSNF